MWITSWGCSTTRSPPSKKGDNSLNLAISPWQHLLLALDVPAHLDLELTPTPEQQEHLLYLDGDRTAEIIALRFGLRDGRAVKQREIAAALGLSRQRVAQLEERWKGLARSYLGLPPPSRAEPPEE